MRTFIQRRTVGRTAIAAAFFALIGFVFLSWRHPIAPIGRPDPATFSPESVARGEALAAEGHCASCHIRPGGQSFAGGYGVNTPFGIVYGTNITPDPKTGIGSWSLTAFERAMREGVSRDGSHLFPAFPYNAYTELSDEDVGDLYAYLMTRPPSRWRIWMSGPDMRREKSRSERRLDCHGNTCTLGTTRILQWAFREMKQEPRGTPLPGGLLATQSAHAWRAARFTRAMWTMARLCGTQLNRAAMGLAPRLNILILRRTSGKPISRERKRS
jgi:mono/diheme cytochrome c family protein